MPDPSILPNTIRLPRVGVGAVVFKGNAVLLVQRKHPPALGQWAIPGGKVNWGESLQQAAERELLEETRVHVKALQPIFTFELIERDAHQRCHMHYVIVDLAAEYLGGEPAAGDDAAAARWVNAEELAALPVNTTTLRLLREVYGFG